MTFKSDFKNIFADSRMEMPNNSYSNSLSSFCIAGINYRKSDMSVRGKFSLSSKETVLLLQKAVANKIKGCLALSTCNRTEIYGLCNDPDVFVQMLAEHSQTTVEHFYNYGYVLRGIDAIDHLFKVASGLDSQIIGDYEILSQLKLAARVAKENGCINNFMERAINYALQVSKEIKTKTKLSSGTVSVAYAAIEIIKERIAAPHKKKILLVGTGKFGNLVAKNICDYLPGAQVTFANRTNAKAEEMAEIFNAGFVEYTSLPTACDDADVIIVSSASGTETIFPYFFKKNKSRLILDLSVPANVHADVRDIPGIDVLNVDEVSSILDKTISLRRSEIPKALKIINETLSNLEEWHRNQFNNPLLRMVKMQLHELNKNYFIESRSEDKIHKAVSTLALQLKIKNNKGCQCINALNNYLHETTT